MYRTSGLDRAAAASEGGLLRQRCAVYAQLTKARLVALVLLTTAVGFVLADQSGGAWPRLAWTVLGTGLAACGANALNQWMEQAKDALMQRTRGRPVPSGRLSPRRALAVGAAMAAAGPLLLAWRANLLTAALALVAVAVYVLVYTPMKTRAPACTLFGAVAGALPPMMGWSAATGRLGAGAWLLGTVLFIWQIPHFMSLGWLYRNDYHAGGFRLLPVVDRSGQVTCQVVVLYTLALVPVGLALTLAGVTGRVYAAGAVTLGIALSALGVELYRHRTARNARRLFLASVIYLPLLLGLMVSDQGSGGGTMVSSRVWDSRPRDLGPASFVERLRTEKAPLQPARFRDAGQVAEPLSLSGVGAPASGRREEASGS